MGQLKKWLHVVAGAAVVLFSLSSVAGNDKKQVAVDMEVPPNQTTAPFTVTATITNEGNSNPNSFELFVTGVTVVGVVQPASGKATFTGSSVSVQKMNPLKSQFTVSILVNTCSDAQWTAVAWTGAQLNGQSLNLDVAHSTLGTSISCGDVGGGAAFVVPDSIVGNCVIEGNRGAYDKNGNTPASVPYFVTDTIPVNGQVHFRWPVDNSGDPAAAFIYTITCPGPLPPETDFAWFNTDGTPSTGTSGTPDFIDTDTVPDCLPPAPSNELGDVGILPVPYGTLKADVGDDPDTDTTITLDTTIPGGVIAPPGTPGPNGFDIVIGSERMTVIACEDTEDGTDSGDDSECAEQEEPQHWTVIRGVGGTAVQKHFATPTALVMYTPLPIMTITQGVAPYPAGPEYKAGNQAQMCVVKQTEAGDQSQHSTTFIDIGDGWGGHP